MPFTTEVITYEKLLAVLKSACETYYPTDPNKRDSSFWKSPGSAGIERCGKLLERIESNYSEAYQLLNEIRFILLGTEGGWTPTSFKTVLFNALVREFDISQELLNKPVKEIIATYIDHIANVLEKSTTLNTPRTEAMPSSLKKVNLWTPELRSWIREYTKENDADWNAICYIRAKELVQCFNKLHQKTLLNQSIFHCLLNYSAHAGKITDSLLLFELNELTPSEAIINYLCLHAAHADVMGKALVELVQHQLLTSEMLTFLSDYPEHADKLAAAIINLHGTPFYTVKNLISLAKDAEYAPALSYCLRQLHEHQITFTEYDISILRLFIYSKKSSQISWMFHLLKSAGLLIEKNIWSLFDQLSSNHFDPLCESISQLNKNNLLNAENLKLLFEFPENALAFSRILVTLNERGLLNENQMTQIRAQIAHIDVLAWACVQLHRHQLLTVVNLELLLDHPDDIGNLCWGIVHLQQHELLTPENQQFLLAHFHDIVSLSAGMVVLHKNNLLEENQRALGEHAQHAQPLSLLMETFSKENLPNPTNKKLHINLLNYPFENKTIKERLFEKSQHAHSIQKGFETLKRSKLQNPENVHILLAHAKHADSLSLAMSMLKNKKLLSNPNREKLISNQKCSLGVSLILARIQKPTQSDFDNLIRFASVFGRANVITQINNLPNHLLTRDRFARWLEYCTQNQATAADNIIREIRGALNADRGNNLFNDNQNTHTRSVHKSTSQSAAKLHARYHTAHELDKEERIEAKLKEIKNWLKTLPKKREPSDVNAAAMRAFERLTDHNYHFTDSTSQVTTRQLLVLIWIGMYDKDCTREETTLETLKDSLAQALYDSQRGYNQNHQFADDQQKRDKSICPPGTFNKLLETLNHQHCDVEIIFKTRNTALVFIQSETKNKAKQFLLEQVKSTDPDKLEKLRQDLSTIRKDGEISVIWESIKPSIEESIKNEFSELFEGQQPTQFEAFIANGAIVELTEEDIDAIEKLLPPMQSSVVLVR